jgi:hypothetical protein
MAQPGDRLLCWVGIHAFIFDDIGVVLYGALRCKYCLVGSYKEQVVRLAEEREVAGILEAYGRREDEIQKFVLEYVYTLP